MDAKEIKSTLKQAKDAVKNKDIQTALQLCKAVLKVDRNNYLALVLLGAAFQESEQKDQAPNAFRKAIEVSPDQILAWQGLASFYEKENSHDRSSDLIPVYRRLLQLERDDNKWCEIMGKLTETLLKTVNIDELTAVVEEQHELVDTEDKQRALRKLVTHCLANAPRIPELYVFEEVFSKSLKTLATQDDIESCKVYLKLLYQQRNIPALFDYAIKLSMQEPYDEYSHEWLCKAFAEQYVENRESVLDFIDEIVDHYEMLLSADENSVVALMAKGALKIATKEFTEARDILKQCISINGGLWHAHCLLCEVQLILLNHTDAEQSASTALELLKNKNKEEPLVLHLLLRALSFSDQPDDWDRASELLRQLYHTNTTILECAARVYLQRGCWMEFDFTIQKLSDHQSCAAAVALYEAEAKIKRGEGDPVELLKSVADTYPEQAEAWLKLGIQYGANSQHQEAFTAFLKAAKLSPHWYTVYLHLGHQYSKHRKELDKARRCYMKAFHLNPQSVEAASSLSDVYKALGDVQNNINLLTMIAQTSTGKWACLRLALEYLHTGDTESAITYLRPALKADPGNSHLWETLADTYYAKEAYIAALKSYERVLELRPGSFYPTLQIAKVKMMIDLPNESLTEFRQLVRENPHSLPALKGLCEINLFLARDYSRKRLLGLTRDRLQEAVLAITRAVEVKPEYSCFWKLLGDALTLAGQLPSLWSYLKVPQVLRSEDQDSRVCTIDLLKLGSRCFLQALRIMGDSPVSSLVWCDLAYNYRLQILFEPDGNQSETLCNRALGAAKKSVQLAPQRWQHWNQLGIIAALPGVKKLALAQHAFIKSIMAEDLNPVPWSNLGVLYLTLDNLTLANKAFNSAQKITPEFGHCWIGQALIAEKTNYEETMDLFRHTTQLVFHPESSMGYAQWVCSTLQCFNAKNDQHYIYSIEKMHAVPVATDSLVWATAQEEKNACGLNMLGCLFERSRLYANSINALSKALEVVPTEYDDIVRGNLARVLCKAGRYKDSIKMYQSMKKADFESQCGLAIALYKGEMYEDALSTYETALHWLAPDDGMKAQLLVAMAAVVYKLHGPEKAKTYQFQAIQLKPISVHGLFATCALGMLHKDLTLSKRVLKELGPFQDQMDSVAHIATFQSYIEFLQGNYRQSLWSMSKMLHRHPTEGSLWFGLAVLILNRHITENITEPKSAIAAAKCAQTAMVVGRNNMDVSKVLPVVSLSHLIGGNKKSALSVSQHAVHLYPNEGESWAVLAASTYFHCTPNQIRSFVSFARQNLDLGRPLAKWMSNFERKVALLI